MLGVRERFPGDDLNEGVYIDDHIVIGRIPKAKLYHANGLDKDLISRSHDAYESVGLQRSPEKAFGFGTIKIEPPITNKIALIENGSVELLLILKMISIHFFDDF